MPPVWEYFAPGGYRSVTGLTGDLAKIARYVAINPLFTTSPLYPPGYTPQRLPSTINLYVATFDKAKLAYEAVRAGAAKAGVTVNASQIGVFVQDPAGRVPIKQSQFRTYVDYIDPDSPRFQR